MKIIQNKYLAVLVFLILFDCLVYGQTPQNPIQINFPTNWTQAQSNGGTSSTSPSRKSQIFVLNTSYADINTVYEKILNSYFQKNFTNLTEMETETADGDGLTRTMVMYSGIAKNDKKPIYLITQFAKTTDDANAKIILYTGTIRQSEGEQTLDLVSQSFRTIAVMNKTSAPAPITNQPPSTNQPTIASTSLKCPGSKLTESEIGIILKQHNDERAIVGVPPLVWNCALANYAQKWANQGIFEHSSSEQLAGIIPGIEAGENLAADTESNAIPGVSGWLEEKQFWNNQTGTCREGEVCGHYTQMVWRTTTQIGCGINRNAPGEYRQLFVCNYSPAGNAPGPAY